MRRLASARNGIATTEFALLAPLITTLLFGFLEFAWVLSARSALESATMKGARQIAATDCSSKREELLTQTVVRGMQHIRSSDGQPPKIEAKSYAGAFSDIGEPEPFTDAPPKNGKYDVGESYTDVNGSGAWEKDMGKAGSVGGANQVVSYTATYRVKSIIPWLAKRFGDGTEDYAIKATTVIRNEPVFRDTGCPQT